MRDSLGSWRWNVNPTWENVSSLYQESRFVLETKNEFQRYHHLKAALYFGVGAIESFLNERMRQKMEKERINEGEIFKKLKSTSLPNKLEKWLKEIAKIEISLSDDLLKLIDDYRVLRNEITHPKVKDHSIYRNLDEINIEITTTTITEFIVAIFEACNETFPYWLLGWNFIGLNKNPTWPMLINNQQFIFAIRALGLNVPTYDAVKMDSWEHTYMRSISDFKKLKEFLNDLDKCEPKDNRFPQKPRLCRRWWDFEHVKTCGQG